MIIRTKFNVGDLIYTVIKEAIESLCPSCEGVGNWFLKSGKPVTTLYGKCSQCGGKGKVNIASRWIVEGPLEIDSLNIHPIHSQGEADHPEVMYMNREISKKSPFGDEAFATEAEAQAWCNDHNTDSA